ncbi:transcriptional regulator domain-containing protein [Reyranella sp.]|uniref:transcriptional regulator domain-containing protein n=1 Tax=Reyranella sp. TaxID=1929291 RepID=UPI0027201D20|nr:DUF6499 domain-containing protein [Reyranella sp.]MDO8972411.1 DUF6499 domain-containing protein [Reyranella sp.]
MTKRPDWRSPDYVDALKNLDRAGFAWEFLRRNPAYRDDYAGIAEDPDKSELSSETVGGNWGLSFRLQSGPQWVGGAGFMAA